VVSSDESDDADGFVPPLPAEDRLWRHPSEMASNHGPSGATAGPSRTDAAGATPTRPPARRRVVVLSAVAGVVLALGVIAAVGTVERDRDTAVGEVALEPPPEPTVLEALGPALARLDATGTGADAVSTATRATVTTAVVYRSDGYLLAAADAVTDATQLTVTLADGRSLAGRLVGADAVSGIAVVKVEAVGLTAAAIGDDATVEPGDDALAVSHDPDPAGAPVVAEGRVMGTGWRLDGADGTRHGLIRAALGVTPASSGGALLCSPGGRLLGVVLPDQPGTVGAQANATASDGTPGTTPATTDTDSDTSRFATPISLAVRVADEIVATGQAHYARLGVQGADLDAERAAALGRTGAVVTDVEAGGPADQGGLLPGDLVTAVDAQPVRSISELVVALRDRRPGDVITLSYLRDGQTGQSTVTLADSAT
jgi:S1-C subfamily serine protease